MNVVTNESGEQEKKADVGENWEVKGKASLGTGFVCVCVHGILCVYKTGHSAMQ